MASATQHASSQYGNPELLQKFQELNPQLQEIEKIRHCPNLYPLLTSQHRHEGHCPPGSRIEFNISCFTDHREAWQNMETGLPVIIAHPYCPHLGGTAPDSKRGDQEHYRSHIQAQYELADKGLAYRVSNFSWYSEGHTRLVALGRADVVSGINFPYLETKTALPEPTDMTRKIPHIPWKQIMENRLDEEALRREELAQKAPFEEANGNHRAAFLFYCDTALTDREAGFNNLAQEQLGEAKRLLLQQPWLDVNYVHFANDADRKYICGEGLPTIGHQELQAILDRTEVPDGWEKFQASDWDGHARTTIWQLENTWGEAHIEQGGNRNLWSASVQSWTGPMIFSISGENYGNTTGNMNHIFETPHEAVASTVDIWRRYDELANGR